MSSGLLGDKVTEGAARERDTTAFTPVSTQNQIQVLQRAQRLAPACRELFATTNDPLLAKHFGPRRMKTSVFPQRVFIMKYNVKKIK